MQPSWIRDGTYPRSKAILHTAKRRRLLIRLLRLASCYSVHHIYYPKLPLIPVIIVLYQALYAAHGSRHSSAMAQWELRLRFLALVKMS